ncbi:tRNA-dihydrouridine synthase [bacterium]|nr:tRNA-dihydrouridine synthase [bacterium]
MMRDKAKTLKIIQHLSENVQNLSFSLKSRAGLNEQDKSEQLTFLCEASQFCMMISIHGRTLKQGYQGDADRDFIQKVKKNLKNPQCLVIGNGGVRTYDEACQMEQKYGLAGVMIGQGAIGNPWIFCEEEASLEEKREAILRHLDLSVAFDQYFQTFIEERSDFKNFFCIPGDFREEQIQKNLKNPDFEAHAVIEFRKFLFQYVKGIPGSKEWKVQVLSLVDYGKVRDEIQRFFER